MAHIPRENDKPDDFMNASAEEWSKPEVPNQAPPKPKTKTDRWGGAVPPADINSGNRWGAPEMDTSDSPKIPDLFKKKEGKGLQWWVIVLIIAVVLCLCSCGTLAVLAATGVLSL